MATVKPMEVGKVIYYDPIEPDVSQWPIYQLSQKRYEFIQDVIRESFGLCRNKLSNPEAVLDELAKTVYQERIRLTQKPWKADAPDEAEYWSFIRKELARIRNLKDSTKELEPEILALMNSIISRYANEIAGHFDASIYEFARIAIPFGFSRLLKTSIGKNFEERLSQQFSIKDRIKYVGDLDLIRTLAKKHTVVVVPTHFSNIDSMVIGWAIQELGLPAFIYGAGLNLFGIRLIAYFMNRLGAYKVDRRKKNLFYLETLKMYSNMAIQEGCHSIFFPGGTRSRSGSLESKLKLGLLGSSMEAQYHLIEKAGSSEDFKKVIIVPVVFSYHFVLEAPILISEYLKEAGKEFYFSENDRFSTSFKLFNLVLKFLTQSSKIYLSFAPPMDLFGNLVNEEGQSLDPFHKPIDIRGYFMQHGSLKADRQRNEEYIKMLGEKIVKDYHQYNVVFSSHVLAYTAFEMLKKRYRKIDIYGLLQLPAEDRILPMAEFQEQVENVRNRLTQLKSEGKVILATHMHRSTDSLIEHGLKHLGVYHDKRPLVKTKDGNITSDQLQLLYYYHNRLEGYQLSSYVH